MKKQSNSIDGSGRKRPLVDIPVQYLLLDNLNPRLGEEHKKASQDDLFKVLYEEFDIEELAYSMSENGYFDEEPIVVVPKSIPKGFDLAKLKGDTDTLQLEIEKWIEQGKMEFIVVEGNRRASTSILMTNKILREKIGVDKNFPKPKNKEVENDIKILPAIFYFDRDDVSPYLGVRHISGILKWEAFAKAAYIDRRINEELKKKVDADTAIETIRKKLADRSDTIRKQYMAFKIYSQASNDLNFDVSQIRDRFSLINELTSSPDIRAYIGIANYNEVDFNNPIIKRNKFKETERVLIWVFGDGKDKLPVVTDSRKIKTRLAPILADSDATQYLIDYGNLEEAYERSGGEEKYLIKKIDTARKNIENALRIAYKYKKADVKDAVKECKKALDELIKMIS